MALGRVAARRATCPASTRRSTRRPTTAGSRCGAAWSRTRPRWSACSSSSSCVFVAIFGPYLTPYNPIETDMANALKPPSAAHWFGTDQLGMDIFSRVIAGTRVSLTVGLLAVSIALTIGIILGAIAGYAGGRIDTVIMRVMDMMLAIPSILLAITLMAALGQGHRQGGHRHRPGVDPRVRAPRARQHPVHQGERLRRGGAHLGQQRLPHHLPARAARSRCR